MGATHSTNVNNNHSHSKIHTTNSSRQCGASDRLAVSNLRSQLTTIYRNHEDEEEEEEEARRFALVKDFDLSGLKRIRVPRRNHILMDPHKKVRPLFILSPMDLLLLISSDSILKFLDFCCLMSPTTTLEGTVANHYPNFIGVRVA